jgi:fructokinase
MAIYTIGEALIDMMPEGEAFLPAVGGAPANVAACAARLNGEAHFIGMVGEDLFGHKILRELSFAGVGTRYLYKTARANTALAFVALGERGEREFAFYRKPSADMFLEPKDVEGIDFHKEDYLHFCSVDLLDMPVRYATIRAIEKCREAGGMISFDPNIRLSLWENKEEYKRIVSEFLLRADIIKLAEDEVSFLFENANIEEVVDRLLKTASEVLVTLGARGSILYQADGTVQIQKPFLVHPVDTTGAGDTFIATYLRYRDIIGKKAALERAGAASAMVCTKKGVLPSLPSEAELLDFMEKAYEKECG